MARKMANRCIPDSPRYVPTPVVAATFDQCMEVVRRQCEIEPGGIDARALRERLPRSMDLSCPGLTPQVGFTRLAAPLPRFRSTFHHRMNLRGELVDSFA